MSEGGRAAGPSPLETLHPATFALVMATGIVSTATHLLGFVTLARVLLASNAFFYVALWVLYGLRLWRFPHAMRADFADHGRGVGFLTIVAATCVFGAQLVIIVDLPDVARALWILALVLYVGLVYTWFPVLTVARKKPGLDRGINGTWLVLVVATQGISVLGGNVWNRFPGHEQEVLFATLAFWLAGAMIYVWLIALIVHRYIFSIVEPGELVPGDWIDMGAMAISTLAGDVLIANAPHDPLLTRLLPFLQGLTLLFWATATWWIPMLLVLGYWRHVVRRFPLRYDPGYWGMVFPLGMYTAATWKLAGAIDAPFLLAIPRVTIWVALAAWSVVFVGLVRSLIRPQAGAPPARA